MLVCQCSSLFPHLPEIRTEALRSGPHSYCAKKQEEEYLSQVCKTYFFFYDDNSRLNRGHLFPFTCFEKKENQYTIIQNRDREN